METNSSPSMAAQSEAERNMAAALEAIIQALESRKTRVNMPDGMSVANYARTVLSTVAKLG